MDLPQFERTTCNCPNCSSFCFASPGGLAPSDLPNIVPQLPDGSYDLPWCEDNLLLTFDTSVLTNQGIVHVPVLIPGFTSVLDVDGTPHDAVCIYLKEGDCSIHDHSPWGCRMFGGGLSEEEETRRSRAMINEIISDFRAKGPYSLIVRNHTMKRIVAPSKEKRMVCREYAEKRITELFIDHVHMN